MYLFPLSQVLSAGVRVGVAALVLLLAHGPVQSAPLGTALTHKGEYKPSGVAVTGVYDFHIVFFNVATVGTAIGTVARENVQVTQGNFIVEVDYGAPPFATATQYWLETWVRPGISAGGVANIASGGSSTVVGGQGNTTSGAASTVAESLNNAASGDFSFVVGRYAKNTDPTHHGVFMFADSQNADFFSAGPNTFNVRTQGGMHLNPQTNLFFGVQTRQMLNLWNSGPNNYGIGVQTSTVYFRSDFHFAWFRGDTHHNDTFNAGGGDVPMRLEDNGNLYTAGAVNPPSDRNVKTDFTAIDTTELLEKVAVLPIQSWRYKHDRGTRHIGPVAQDFHAAFQVGTDDKHIATADADGVALAAIQELHQKLEQENTKLGAENAEMKARLAALEAQATKQGRTHTRLEALEARFERMFQALAGE